MRSWDAAMWVGRELYQEVVLDKLAHARESVLISTANVKEMQIEQRGSFRSILALFNDLSARGVSLRLLHAELPSRPFRAAFDKRNKTCQLRAICPDPIGEAAPRAKRARGAGPAGIELGRSRRLQRAR